MTRAYFGDSLSRITLCNELDEAHQIVGQQNFDLLLLDLNLNGEDGFEVLKTTVAEAFHTIIISAYKEKAITAFEYGVLDFVPKPFSEERLAQAFSRISTKANVGSGTKYLAVKKRGSISLINTDDIRYIKGAGIYTELHLKNGQKEIHDKSLEKLEQLLPASFLRIHKSYLLNLSCAKEIIVQPGSRYDMLLQDGEALPIGRTRYKELKEKLFSKS